MADIIWTTSGDSVKQRLKTEGPLTIRQAQQLLCPARDDFRLPTLAIVGGRPVLRRDGGWERELPVHVVIVFVELPLSGGGGGGGGSNAVSVIFAVAAVALMAWNPGLAFATNTVWGLGLTGGMASFVGGMITGGLVLGMGVLAGVIAGQQSVSSGQVGAYNAESSSPTYNVNASGNAARMYQPEPEGFGRMLIVPDFAAKKWAMYIENDQYGFFVYALGRGVYNVESLQFGDTVFWKDGEFVDSGYAEGLEIQIVKPGEKVTLFPDNVYTASEVAGQELYGPNNASYDGPVGPYAANPAGTTITKIYIDIVWPNGLGQYDNNRNLCNFTVGWRFDYRKIDDYGDAQSDWAVLNEGSLTMGTTTPQRRTLECEVAEGRWQVRANRTTNTAADGKTYETVQWMALRGMVPGSLTYPQSTLALKIRGQNKLSQGASNNLKVLLTRMLPLWDAATRTWSEPVATRSWGAAICAVAKADYGGRRTDDQLDLDKIWSLDAKMEAKSWHYDAYLDGSYNVWQLMIEMCQPMLCLPRLEGTIFSVIEDGTDRTPRYMLTPRTIRRGTFKITYNTWDEQSPDDVTIEYLDEDAGYAQRDVTAVLPESESNEPTGVNMLGIVNRDHAYQVAVGYAARNRWRRIQVECEVEGIGKGLNYGDVCIVSHPRLRDSASGVVRGWDDAGLTLVLRKDCGDLPDAEPYLTLVTPSGQPWGPVLLADIAERGDDLVARMDAEDYAALLLQGFTVPFGWLRRGGRGLATGWMLQAGSTFNRRMIVTRVVPSGLYQYALTLVNDDSRVASYNLPTPAWEQRGQLPTVDELAAPAALTVRVGYDSTGGRLLKAAWLTVAGADGYEVQTSADGTSWARQGRYNVNAAEVPVPAGLAWLRVCAVTTDLQSDWTRWQGDTELAAPAAPAGVSYAYVGGALSLTWEAVPTASAYAVSIYDDSADAVLVADMQTVGVSLTLADMRAKGGPWRSLSAVIVAVNAAGHSPATEIPITDPAPEKVMAITAASTSTTVAFSDVSGPVAADVTGYVIARGTTAAFDMSSVAEARVVGALPFVWDGLSPDTTYYFRVAGKDAFYDAMGDAHELQFSDVLAIATTSGS